MQFYKQLVFNTLRIAAITFIIYSMGTYAIHLNQLHFTNYPTWLFRLCLIGGIIGTIVSVRKSNNYYISYPQGVMAGLIGSVVMGILFGINTYIMREYVNPTYNADAKEAYRSILQQEKNRDYPDQPKWTAEQIDKQLNERWSYFFTTKGGMFIDLGSAVALGFMIAITVAYMARRTQDKD